MKKYRITVIGRKKSFKEYLGKEQGDDSKIESLTICPVKAIDAEHARTIVRGINRLEVKKIARVEDVSNEIHFEDTPFIIHN